MGLLDKLKKQTNKNDEYRQRSISDVRVPSAFVPLNVPAFDDVIISRGSKYEKTYFYDDVSARLFGSLPSGNANYSFSSDGKYLLLDDKRIASIFDRSDMIRDYLSRGDVVLVAPRSRSDSDLLLTVCFYKKVRPEDLDPQSVEFSIKVSSADSYFSCSELIGLKLDDISLDPDSLLFCVYSSGSFVAMLPEAKSSRISDIMEAGSSFSSGVVISAEEFDSGLSYIVRIRLSFI